MAEALVEGTTVGETPHEKMPRLRRIFAQLKRRAKRRYPKFRINSLTLQPAAALLDEPTQWTATELNFPGRIWAVPAMEALPKVQIDGLLMRAICEALIVQGIFLIDGKIRNDFMLYRTAVDQIVEFTYKHFIVDNGLGIPEAYSLEKGRRNNQEMPNFYAEFGAPISQDSAFSPRVFVAK